MSQMGKFISAGSIGGVVGTLTGNVGGAVGPDGVANIDFVGTTPVTVTGTPASNLLTITVDSATTTTEGIIELTTDAEAIAGTDTTRAITSSTLKAKLGTQVANTIPYGAGTSSALSWTGAGTDGQLVIAATGAAPAFASLTSASGFITFTPGANTLDLNTSGSVAVSFDGDSGTATPALGVLNIVGGSNITTAAAASTVTINVSGTTDHSLQLGNASGSLTSLGVATDGQLPIGSSGLDPVLGNITATDGTLTVTNSAGKIDIEAGTGLLIMSGFEAWSGGSPYFDDTTLGSFTVSQAGTGYVKGEPVSWAGGQTVTGMTAGNTYYIYMDDTGTIQKTTTYNDALFRDNIVLFEVLRDSTSPTNNQLTVKENHPYTFPWNTSVWAHDTIGSVIADQQGGANITLNGTQKIEISGVDELEDHGLETTIPDSGGVAETWEQYYTNGSGKWALYASSDTFDGTWNSSGTPTAIGNNKYTVNRLYVSKDNINSSTPKYISVMGDAEYNNLAAADTAIANDSIPTATGELAMLELAQLGYIVFEESTTSIVQVVIAKETARTSFSGVTATTASLVLTDTTNFDHILSAADTTVQSALETIDDLTFNGDSGSSQAASAVFTFAGGNNLTTAGAGSTITLDVDGNVADSFPTDSGTGTPSLGVLTVAGGTGITTSASGSTVTITATGAVSTEFTDDTFRIIDDGDNTKKLAYQCSGITTATTRTWTVDDRDIDFDAVATSVATDGSAATPAAGTFTIAGGNNCTTSGSGSTVTVAVDGNVADSFSTDSGSATPAAGVITIAGGTNVTTSGSGSTVTINSSGGGGITWNEVTGTSQGMSVDNGYIANNASLVTLTLPDTAALGSVVRVCGKGAGGWKIAQNASESIIWDESTSTTVGVGGSLDSTDDYDAVELLCTVADTTWTVLSSKGNISIT